MVEWLNIESGVWVAAEQITMARLESDDTVAVYVIGRDEPVIRTNRDNWSAIVDRRSEKRKIAVSLSTKSGEIFEGHVFVSGNLRVKDQLNGPEDFIAFETMGGQLYLIARSELARVVPRAAPTEQASTDFA